MTPPTDDLKSIPFGAVLHSNRKVGKIFGLYGRIYKVMEVDRQNRTLLLERISQDVGTTSGTTSQI